MFWISIFILAIVVILVVVFYIVNHNNTVDELKDARRVNSDLREIIDKKDKTIIELKRFPKPSDPSRLDAALSEIDDLKSRLRIAEATARDATEKAKLSNSVREERKHYFDKYCELTEENRRLKEEIKTIKQKTPRPQYVYDNAQVEKQIIDYKNKLSKKSEEIKALTYELSATKIELANIKEDLQDLLFTIDELKKNESKSSLGCSDEYALLIKEAVPRVAALPFAQIPSEFKESIESGRLINAFKSHLMIIDKIDMEAKIRSDNDTYKTTLHSCTCPDFTYRHNVCKHMLFLSYTSGLLLLNKDVIESCK